MRNNRFNIPPALKEGDKVAIFLSSSPVKEPYRENGVRQLEKLGFVPVEVNNPLGKVPTADFLARSPEQSFADIQRFFSDPEIKALWAGRGGYGANLLLPFLDRLDMPLPKIVIGSSDVSYLLWNLMERFKMVVYYGPMVYASLAEDRFDAANLKQVLCDPAAKFALTGETLISGNTRGMLTGGCLSNLASLLGTPYFPPVENRILLLEDVGERPFRLDRMLWQLAVAGVFSKIKGLLLGQFPRCFSHEGEKETFLGRVQYYLKDTTIPVLYDLPLGHADTIYTIPLGQEYEINTPQLVSGKS